MAKPTRWVTETSEDHSQQYIKQFRQMSERGVDLGGEARLVDAMVPPNSRVLDAGCGTGRTGAVLQERGHVVVGVDADPELIAAAEQDHAGPRWVVADLAELDLPAVGIDQPFAACVMAGNVLAYVAPDSETQVLRRIAEHLVPDGFVAIGFGASRGYSVTAFDQHLADAGFRLEHRFATWDLRPWSSESDFAVNILRKPTIG
jgi:SAM-dependent methyltransferase